MKCTNCQAETIDSDVGDMHCRKIFLDKLKILISSNDIYDAKKLCFDTKFNQNESNLWKKIWENNVEKLIIDKENKLQTESIKRKLEKNISLDNTEKLFLKKSEKFEILGNYFKDQYIKSNDLWDLSKASSNFRLSGNPKEAINTTNIKYIFDRDKTNRMALGAIYTSRGAAYKDLGNYDKAEICANKAIKCKKTSYVYELLGSVYLRKNEIDRADYYFQKASEYVSNKTIKFGGKSKNQSH